MFKRIVDIIFAAVLLAAVFPLLAIAALLIKLDSGGPVFFCQKRMGRGFKQFQLFKLRTMRPSGEGPVYTLGADPRITRAGRWLRRLKIDELPQLWNVLCGEMSLVGPRPVVPDLAVEFEGQYARLLEVRPGLTDPATLKYFRETEILERTPEPLLHFKTVVTPDKIRISQGYLLEAGVWKDFGVMARTAYTLFVLLWQRPASDRKPAHSSSASMPHAFGKRAWRRRLHPVLEPDGMAGSIQMMGRIEENKGF